MRRRASLIAGAVCGVLCASSVFAYGAEVRSSFESERAEVLARYGNEQVEVWVASRDIEEGDTLNSSNMEKRLWLGEMLPDGAVLSPEEYEGKPVASAIYRGEVITAQRFERNEQCALQVPSSLCSISVPAKAVTAVGGSLWAGSVVDVYVTSDASTDLLAEEVMVLSTSSTEVDGATSSGDEVSWVTLAVEPGLVKELIASSRKSELYFSLPSEADLSSGESDVGLERHPRAQDSLSANGELDETKGKVGP